MADDDAMSPQELASMFFAPSSQQGPEAAPRCVICNEIPVEQPWRQGVCHGCEDRARSWRPDPGPRPEPPQPSPEAVKAYADYMRQAAEQDERWLKIDREIAAHNAAVDQQLRDYQAQAAVVQQADVDEVQLWGRWVKGFIVGAVCGAIATAIFLARNDRATA
jgi:hypothetical protein